MKLKRLTERIWYYPYEEERDRPNLGYIRGDRWSLAVDAGHSEGHVREFYRALEAQGLPLPALTALTHWHWDHAFGLHAACGLSLANRRTNEYLRAYRENLKENGEEAFFALHESIRREYASGGPVAVIPADLEYTGEIRLDAGNCPIRIFQAEAPHTDDASLIHVPGEKTLFLGDAAGGVFPTGERKAESCRKLASVILETNPEICVEGHWRPVDTRDTVADLLTDAEIS